MTALALLGLDPASPQVQGLMEAVLKPAHGPPLDSGESDRAGRPGRDHVAGDGIQRPRDHATSRSRSTANRSRRSISIRKGRRRRSTCPWPCWSRASSRSSCGPAVPRGWPIVARWTGVDPAEFVQGTSAAWSIRRSYEPGPMEVDEKEIPRGFSVLSGDADRAAFSNRMTQLPVARRGGVELEIRSPRGFRDGGEPSAGQAGDPPQTGLLIVEPLPSGARVVPSSLDGCFDRAEILPGRIIFFLGGKHTDGTIHYELEGVFPGSNLISPTILRRAEPRGAVGGRPSRSRWSSCRKGPAAAIRIAFRPTNCWPSVRTPGGRAMSGRHALLHGTPRGLARPARFRPFGRGLQAGDPCPHGTGDGPLPRPGWCSTARSSRRSGPPSRSRSINCRRRPGPIARSGKWSGATWPAVRRSKAVSRVKAAWPGSWRTRASSSAASAT